MTDTVFSSRVEVLHPQVAIVGGGPSALSAATALSERGVEVIVLEREAAAGGIPRHCDHPGFGLKSLRKNMSGPQYARELVARAAAAGAQIHTRHMVTDLVASPAPLAWVTGPTGRYVIKPQALVLATGARERSRVARGIAGSRPTGIYTTGQLQNLVHLQGGSPGKRAVLVGDELVSWSAILTLHEAKCEPVAMVTESARNLSHVGLQAAGWAGFGAPVLHRHAVRAVHGRMRLESVDVEDLDTGRVRRIPCDVLVLTGDWVPDDELARSAGLAPSPGPVGSGAVRAGGPAGPAVDGGLRSSARGVFAIGNLVHPVDTADVAALDGTHVASSVFDFITAMPGEVLGQAAWPVDGAVEVRPGAGLAWVSPSRWSPGNLPARERILVWVEQPVRGKLVIEVVQGGTVVKRLRLPRVALSGKALTVPASALADVIGSGPIEFRLA